MGLHVLAPFSLSALPAVLHSLCLLCCHRYGHDAKVVHFLGKVKPWHHSYDAQRGEVRGQSPDSCQLHPDYLLMWWQLYSTSVLPLLQRAYGDTPFNTGYTEVDDDNVSQRTRQHVNDDGRFILHLPLFSGTCFKSVVKVPRVKAFIDFLQSSREKHVLVLVATITGKKSICSTFLGAKTYLTCCWHFQSS